MFGTIRKHSQGLWIVIIVLVSISMVWFFTNADPSQFLSSGRGGGLSVAQQQEVIHQAVGYWQKTGRLPQRASDLFGSVDLDGDEQGDVDGLILQGAVREDLLNQVDALGIGFDDDAINAIIRQRLPLLAPGDQQLEAHQRVFQMLSRFGPQLGMDVRNMSQDEYVEAARRFSAVGGANPDPATYSQDVYDQLIGIYGETVIRQYFHDELAIRHLNQVMGQSGGLVSSRAVRPVHAESLMQFDTEVAVFRADDYTNKITNVAEQLPQFYTNNQSVFRGQFGVSDRLKFVWIMFPGDMDATVRESQQRAVEKKLLEQGSTVTALRLAAAELPSVSVSEVELAEDEISSHDLGSTVLSRVQNSPTNTVQTTDIAGPGGLFYAGLADRIKVPLPQFGDLNSTRVDEVREMFMEQQPRTLAVEAGRAFYDTLSESLLDKNQTFASLCQTNSVKYLAVPAFSLSTAADTNYALLSTNDISLDALKRAAAAKDPGKMTIALDRITEFKEDTNGGWIMNLKKHIRPEPEAVEQGLAGEVNRRRAMGLMRDRSWNYSRVMRIQLELYVEAKKDRLGELEAELEKIESRLAEITGKLDDPDLPPNETVSLSQEMDKLNASRPELDAEKARIESMTQRLAELQKE
ncbi:MAG: hypothetical protein CMO66_02085 [Verrucomicrobiales bacterium]|mgnify:CR=1 FL=1|nr:hypothetical protein [Verrucomicrobiales bacterium]